MILYLDKMLEAFKKDGSITIEEEAVVVVKDKISEVDKVAVSIVKIL